MNTLTLKISEALDERLAAACVAEHVSKAALVRHALESYLARREASPGAPSALERAGELVGCFEGGPEDLAANPAHLADFGKL